MRVFGVVPVLVGVALLAGTATAGPVPLPPVPPVTVPVPSPPVPLPVIPKLPQPVLAAAKPATASVPSLAQATSGLPGSTATLRGTIPSSSSGGGSARGSSAPSSASGETRVEHFHSSRRWIGTTGSKRRRTTTLTFVLQRAGRVVLTVNEVSPACLGLGRLTFAGHAGLNRIRFAGVVHGRPLAPGTYRLSIRTPSGTVVRRVTLVVVGGSAPSRSELRSLRSANTCRGGGASAAGTTSSSSPTSSTTTGPGAAAVATGTLPQPPAAQPGEAAGLAPQAPNLHSGVLASSVEKTARAIQPLLVALLALSILLLGTASLPREAVPGPRVHDTLARHRLELAALGAGALVAVALAFLLT